MKKLLTLIITAVLALTACIGLTGCKGCNNNKQTITVGYTLYEPMNYENEYGVLVGFDTELALKTFTDLGFQVRFKLIDWNQKYAELDSGTIGCIWNGFTANCADTDGVQRGDKVDFTYNYMTNAQCVIRLNTAPELSSSEQLVGKTVAFEAGSAGDSYVGAIAGNINKKAVTSQMDAVREVLSGTAQYAVVDLLLAKSIAGQGNFANVTINESIVIDAEYYAIGFKKGSPLTALVNAKLVQYAQDGTLATLAEKYGLSNQVITDYSDQIA